MTEAPDQPTRAPDPEAPGGVSNGVPPEGSSASGDGVRSVGDGTGPDRRRRVRRRASRAGTNPSADDAPDVLPPREGPAPGESAHDRWLREQRPPHWE